MKMPNHTFINQRMETLSSWCDLYVYKSYYLLAKVQLPSVSSMWGLWVHLSPENIPSLHYLLSCLIPKAKYLNLHSDISARKIPSDAVAYFSAVKLYLFWWKWNSKAFQLRPTCSAYFCNTKWNRTLFHDFNMSNWINTQIICNCLSWRLLKYWEEMHLPVILNQNNPTKSTSYGMKVCIGMGLERIILNYHILHYFSIVLRMFSIKHT